MPIEKMQSQTTTHHVCGGGLLRLTDNLGLSRAFAGVLGPCCSPLRDGDQGAERLTVLTVAALGFPGVGRQGERTGRSQEPIVIWGHIIADVR